MSLNVSTEAFEDVWERVMPWIQHALDHDDSISTIADVKQAVLEGRCHLFHHDLGAAITLVDSHTRVPTLDVWLAGGEMAAMVALLPSFEALARSLDCRKIAFLGRSGWQRTFLKDAGFRTAAVVMEKTLEVPDGKE